ncbi:MAG: TRAM domain-containing protein [Gemmatimonadaceae bacterium]|nr:TRAM domain-containing protein [Gemmatimonadaceae bacterium]
MTPASTTETLRTLRIDRLAGGGDGVARSDGLVVFVPRTAPGDVVEARVTHDGRARFSRGVLARVLEPSAARVSPPCPHYVHDGCGGCQLQHLTYGAQVQAKAAMVAEAFARIARRTVHVPDVHAAPAPWHYRRKLTLALRPTGDGERPWRAGLHAHEDPDHVFTLTDCALVEPAVMQAWHAVIAAGRHLPDAPSLRAAVRRLGHGVSLVVQGGRAWAEASVTALAAAVPVLRAIWWSPEHGARRLVLDARAADEPGASFVQVNPAMHAVLLADVVARTMAHAPRTVVDAYAGSGDAAAALVARGVRVTAIEADADAAAHAATRLAPPSRVAHGLVEHTLADALPAEVVLLNPPRAGCDAAVMQRLAAARPAPRAIVFVSCDPATLARDVARLPGWRIAHLACYDMFPQTAHIETVCELVPEAA